MDINCDLGEYAEFLENGHDEALMRYVSSVNIACGYHAGNEYIMLKTIEKALEYGIKIGAHPGFNDKANFGRNDIEMSEQSIINLIMEQLTIFSKYAGKEFHHVKPHGALYNMSARRKDYAQAIAEAVKQFNPKLKVYGLSGSISLEEAESSGLSVFHEVFADRAYHQDGRLVSRKQPGAVLENMDQIREQVSAFKNETPFLSLEGKAIQLPADTICIHSDSPNAVDIAKVVFDTIHDK